MVLSNYSIFNFAVSFNIPVNNTFTSVVINDVLTRGLSYTIGNAQIYVNNSSDPLTTGYSDTSNTNPSTGLSTITLTLTDTSIIQPNIETTITIKFPVTITNIDTLIMNQNNNPDFKNTVNISAYINDSAVSEISADSEMNFVKYNLYGFGSSDTSDRKVGINLLLIGSIVVTESTTNPDLYYEYTLNAAQGISFVENSAGVMVISGNNREMIPFTIETLTDSLLKLNFTHTSSIRYTPVYIIVPAVTNDDILNIPADVNTLNNNASAQLVYKLNTTDEVIIESTGPFAITVDLSNSVPQLSNASKVILDN